MPALPLAPVLSPPFTSPFCAVALASALTSLAGCRCVPPAAEEPPQPGPALPAKDAGTAPRPPLVPAPDAGSPFSDRWAAEECPAEIYSPSDSGVRFGICIALRSLLGKASLNGAPVAGPINLQFVAGSYESEIDFQPDGVGAYEVRVMRARYDSLRYHPEGIFPTHAGHEDFGLADMTRNQQRDLALKSHSLRGAISFGGIPWLPVQNQPDVQLTASGKPIAQWVGATNQGGAYEVGLLEGAFSLELTVPRDALGDTELYGWPVSPGLLFSSDQAIDVHIPSSELEAELTVDGQPFPDRRAGHDYELDYVAFSSQRALARSFHEGGTPQLHSIVPKEQYALVLNSQGPPDRSFPSSIFGLPLAPSVDLTKSAAASFGLRTYAIEGGITVDGVPVRPVPTYAFFLFAYGVPGPFEPGFVSYYDVPLTAPSFTLRAFPASYYVALWIDDHLRTDLVEGWYLVERRLAVTQDTKMPIEIATSSLQGKLLVDGSPPPSGKLAGTLIFQGPGGFYRRRLITAGEGSFFLRVPKGNYDISFQVDPETYPGYAEGWQRLITRLELKEAQVAELHYQTVKVTGPLRVGGEVVPDSRVGQREVGLDLRRTVDEEVFTWSFQGGSADYLMRIPKGEYLLTFVIEPLALPGVAFGRAPMGARLVAR
ncbi:MAG: hypothetical protein HYZ28_02440 [Myxococcales bacterium]|nr:hypothetical protein [Myxococcales bacterium]